MKRKLFDLMDTAKFLGVSTGMAHQYINQGKLRPFLRDKVRVKKGVWQEGSINRRGDPLVFTRAELHRFIKFEKPKIKKGRPFSNPGSKEASSDA